MKALEIGERVVKSNMFDGEPTETKPTEGQEVSEGNDGPRLGGGTGK